MEKEKSLATQNMQLFEYAFVFKKKYYIKPQIDRQ